MQAIELGIKTKRVVYRGEKCYKILEYSCYDLEDDRLPLSYFEEFPFCFIGYDGEFVVATNDKSLTDKSPNEHDKNNYIFEVGDYISKDDFEKLMEAIKYCGEKLHNLNVKIKEMRAEWKGNEDFKI